MPVLTIGLRLAACAVAAMNSSPPPSPSCSRSPPRQGRVSGSPIRLIVPFPRRRRHRRGGAAAGRAAVGRSRPAGARRQQGRRRRRDRHRDRRQGATRRLHAPAHHAQHTINAALRAACPTTPRRISRRSRSSARCRCCWSAIRPCRSRLSRASSTTRARTRARSTSPCRQRHAAARHDGTADGQGAHAGDQRALSRRRTGAGRPGGRPGPGQARHLHAVGAVRRRQQAQRARRHQPQAAEATPRRPDRGRDGFRLRGLSWMGIVAPAATPAADPRQARHRHQALGRPRRDCRRASTRTASNRSATRRPSSRRRSPSEIAQWRELAKRRRSRSTET